MPLLDTVVPEYEAWERHSVALPVAPERALQVAELGGSETEFVAGLSPRGLKAIAHAAA